MVSLEGGWDLTPILTCLSQILLDPVYRTFEGFRTLVDREFLSFGHRFTHNGIHESSGPNPVFILFLDCCNQILNQNPTSFQFSSFYLQTLAYHCYSARFSTFLLDSDYDRVESGVIFDEKSCFWVYLEKGIKIDEVTQEPVKIKLINQTYSKNNQRLYVSDLLFHFNIFDIFVIKPLSIPTEFDNLLGELKLQSDEQTAKKRKIVYGVYDDVFEIQRSNLESIGINQNQSDESSSTNQKIEFKLNQSSSVPLAASNNVLKSIARCRAMKGDKDASSLVNGIDDEDRLIKPLKGSSNHQGYLYKQTNSLYKGWRLSFFVIEDRQTLVQYEGDGDDKKMEKSIDLKDLIEVGFPNIQNQDSTLPNKSDPKAAIHVKLRKGKNDIRKYSFVARDVKSAEEWINALRDCIA
jgi:myotubularin-related protein 5/13